MRLAGFYKNGRTKIRCNPAHLFFSVTLKGYYSFFSVSSELYFPKVSASFMPRNLYLWEDTIKIKKQTLFQ